MNSIGVYGLGTMGLNIARNLASHNFKVAGYNRENEVIKHLKYPNIEGFEEENRFIKSLEKPRIVLLMVTAGPAVDQVISQIRPFLDKGDIIIDGGNSFYKDSNRRSINLKQEDLRFVAMGVSGGEKGALQGPSLMPSCDEETYRVVKPYLEAIAARDSEGSVCCKRLGQAGAGHFIKTVHNGIEYAEMQAIADTYELLKSSANLDDDAIYDIFVQWNQGLHRSYLMGITADILKKKDEYGRQLLTRVEDIAVQNGTGRWTIQSAVEAGVSSSILYSALEARIISESRKNRIELSSIYKKVDTFLHVDEILLDKIKSSLLCSRITIYEQGLTIIKSISEVESWGLNINDVLSVWKSGCIIESALVDDLSVNYKGQSIYSTAPYGKVIERNLQSWRTVNAIISEKGIYAPTLHASLSYFEGMISKRTSANLIQAMRNYFGAHPYKLIDEEGMHNTDWCSDEEKNQ